MKKKVFDAYCFLLNTSSPTAIRKIKELIIAVKITTDLSCR